MDRYPYQTPPSLRLFLRDFSPQLFKTFKRSYSLDNLWADAIAGSTVAVVGLPLAVALSIASGAPPASGLYCAIIGGFIVSALGGSRYQIGGPAAAFVSLIATTISAHGLQGLLMATILAGFILIALGYMRFGSYIKYIPHSVPVGFSAGVAIILLVGQLKEFLGLEFPQGPSGLLATIVAIWSTLDSTRFWTVALSCASLAFIIYQRRNRPRFPAMLTTVLAGALTTALLGLPVDTIGSRFGALPSLMPAAAWPSLTLSQTFEVTPAAIAIAALAAIESLISAVIADGMTGGKHNSNAELAAQGFANVFSGLFGGICCAGALARTATNIRSGASSPLSGMLASGLMMGTIIVASPLASYIPMGTLAAILMLIAWDMVDRDTILAVIRSDRNEAVVLSVTFLMTVFRDPIEGIAVGVSFGSLLFMHRMAQFVEEQMSESLIGAHDEVDEEGNHHINGLNDHDGVLVYRIKGPLFFGVSSTILEVLEAIDPEPRAFFIDFSRVPFVDGSAADAFGSFARKAKKAGKQVFVISANSGVRNSLISNGSDETVVAFVSDELAARNRVNETVPALAPVLIP